MVACTVSAGIAMPVSGGTWATRLRQADIALYHAKVDPGGITAIGHRTT